MLRERPPMAPDSSAEYCLSPNGWSPGERSILNVPFARTASQSPVQRQCAASVRTDQRRRGRRDETAGRRMSDTQSLVFRSACAGRDRAVLRRESGRCGSPPRGRTRRPSGRRRGALAPLKPPSPRAARQDTWIFETSGAEPQDGSDKPLGEGEQLAARSGPYVPQHPGDRGGTIRN
jgi:hypothetical protein